MGYNNLKYQTPNHLIGAHSNKNFLIIGSGTSTKQLIPFKHKIKNRFDIVIGINLTTLEFEGQMDYHLIVEKNPQKMYGPMNDGTHNYRRDLPRILNWKAITYFPKDIKVYKTTRNRFDGKPNIRKYVHNNQEGLLIGPPDSKGLSSGTSSMCALHLASIMGATKIYLVGADLLFKDKSDHFYPDNLYRKSTTKLANRSPIIKVMHKNREYESTEFFRESAKFFDFVISTYCKRAGIKVYDFSDGLISKAIPVNINEFFGD
jgi:hypothetical protein